MSKTRYEIDDLYAAIKERKGGNAETSYTAKLFSRGRDKIAQKLGEEATEVIIEAVKISARKPFLRAPICSITCLFYG